MKSLNYIFGVTPGRIGNNIKLSDLKTGLITNVQESAFPIGTPCLITETTSTLNFRATAPKRRTAFFPFPSFKGSPPRYKLDNHENAPSLVVKEISDENIITNCKNVEIDRIKDIELNEILDHVKDLNTLNLSIKASDYLSKDFLDFMMAFNDVFNITSVIYKHFNKTKAYKEYNPCLSIVISDIKNHIPIFDSSQSDGVFMNICMYWPKLTEQSKLLTYAFEISTAFSNFSKNLLEIDGQNLNRDSTDENSFNHLISKKVNPYIDRLSTNGEGEREKEKLTIRNLNKSQT